MKPPNRYTCILRHLHDCVQVHKEIVMSVRNDIRADADDKPQFLGKLEVIFIDPKIPKYNLFSKRLIFA